MVRPRMSGGVGGRAREGLPVPIAPLLSLCKTDRVDNIC